MSDRGVLGGKVVPYFDEVIKKLVIATIEADNEAIRPSSQETFEVKHIKRALSKIDEEYGLNGLLMIDGLGTEPKEFDIDLDRSGSQIDLNIRLNIDDGKD